MLRVRAKGLYLVGANSLHRKFTRREIHGKDILVAFTKYPAMPNRFFM
jgi:hypothetical protein